MPVKYDRLKQSRMLRMKNSLIVFLFIGVVAISLNREFIEKCRDLGRVTIDEALDIAEHIGIFDDDYAVKAIVRDKKQRVRIMLSNVTRNGDRVIRSVKLDDGRVYIDLLNLENLPELNMLILAESQRIEKSKQVIKSLKRVKRSIQGQMTLEEYFGDAL